MFELVRLVRSVAQPLIARVEAINGDGIVDAVEGNKASLRIGGPTSPPLPGFFFSPSLDVRAGDHVSFIKLAGFQAITGVWNRNALVLPAPAVCRKISDETVAVTALADSAGMSIAVEPGTYLFEFYVYCTTAAVTDGIRLSVNGPASSAIRWGYIYPWGLIPNAAYMGVGQSTAWNAEPYVYTDGPGTGGAMAVLAGSFVATAAGSLVLRHGSETAINTTILAGSWGRVTRVS